MKKFLLFGFLLAIVSIMATGCNSCKSENKQDALTEEQVIINSAGYDGVAADFTAGVSNIQALHRQTMYSTLGVKQFEWRNSKVLFNDSINYENIDELKVVEVTDVFYYWDSKKGPQVHSKCSLSPHKRQ